MASPQTIIVTGANRGIGQAICRLLLGHPSFAQGPHKVRLLATSRKGQDLNFGGDHSAEVLYPRLDLSSKSSIAAFTDYVRDEIKSVHVLINNAGVNLETGQMAGIPGGPSGAAQRYELAKTTLDVNYFGTKSLTLSLLPFLSPYQNHPARVVSLSSVASSLAAYSPPVQARFRNTNATIEDVDRLARDFLTTVENSTEEQNGYSLPGRSYSISKALVNALTAILARQNPGVLFNSCCPGWIATDMGELVGSGRTKPPKTPEEGAQIPLKLALGDIDGVTGKYWANPSVRSKDSGQVQDV